VAGFCISGVELRRYATRQLISKIDLRETGCEDGSWVELAQDRIQCGGVEFSVSANYESDNSVTLIAE
jgi:hypothetical protein